MEKETRKTQLTFICKDGTKRIVNAIGIWTTSSATDLGKDLEGDNLKYVTVNIL